MSVTLYGIPNCDTVAKARRWLEQRGVVYTDSSRLAGWVEQLGWEKLLNRSGTTFKKLPEVEREGIDAEKAVEIMMQHPSTIKRPVVEYDGGLLVGFKASEWEELLL